MTVSKTDRMAVKQVLNLLAVAAKFIYPTSHHLANLFCAKNGVVQAGSGWIWPLFMFLGESA